MTSFAPDPRQRHLPDDHLAMRLAAEDAEDAALAAAYPKTCTCYDVDTMEWAPEPCDHCKAWTG